MERKSEKKTALESFFFFTEIGGEDLRKDEYFEKFWRWYN